MDESLFKKSICSVSDAVTSLTQKLVFKWNLPLNTIWKQSPYSMQHKKNFASPLKEYSPQKKKSNSQNIPGCVLLLCQFYHMCLSHEKIHNSVIYQTFMKFSCKVWFADFVLIFEGTQLVKVWEIMRSCLRDVKKLT